MTGSDVDRRVESIDVDAKEWRAAAGELEVHIGSSSADIALRGALLLARTATAL